jgi:hypothetical protein
MTVATDPAPVTGRPRRNPAAPWVLSILVALVLAGGAAVYVWWHGQVKQYAHSTTTRDDYSITDSLTITVTGSADLVLRSGSDGTTVQTLRESDSATPPGTETSFSADAEHGELALSTDCGHGCRVTFTVWVPLDTPLTVTTPGQVTVQDVTGQVTVQAGGNVTLAEARVVDLAVTSQGSISGSMASVPNTLRLEAPHGDVDLDLPDGGAAYAVQVTGGGQRKISVPQDPGSANKVTITLGRGDLTLR